MKIKNILTLFACINLCFAQEITLNLKKGNVVSFAGGLYCAGLVKNNSALQTAIYKLDENLKKTDSLFISIGNGEAEKFLEIYFDTLHNYLNFYVQEKDQKEVCVLRLDKNLKLIEKIDGVEVARLNNSSMFSNDKLFFENSVYDTRTISDSSGMQFYLNKYSLKNETGNFEYIFKWQFPFEKKDVYAAHVFHANKQFVYLYVWRKSEYGHLQWVLKINSETGNLIRATKINKQDDYNIHQFGSFAIDEKSKGMYLCGQRLTQDEQLALTRNSSSKNQTEVQLWFCLLDSLGEITERSSFKIPVKQVQSGIKKGNQIYVARINSLRKTKTNKIQLDVDLYKKTHSDKCLMYTTSEFLTINLLEDGAQMSAAIFTLNTDIEFFYTTNDKHDMNAKLCNDTPEKSESLFFEPLVYNPRVYFKTDEALNPMWILRKSETRKNAVNYTFLKPEKKIYKLSVIESIKKTSNPMILNITENKFLISSQGEEGYFQIKLYNW